ncbi:MAG: hypothetical protein LIP77_09340 [Planctomycetes bacterium]|nr:hypothetical protein [Planctomycetota bacterium]
MPICNYSYDPTVLSVSRKVWARLTDEEKEIFQNAATAACRLQVASSRENDQRIHQLIEDAGVQIHVMTRRGKGGIPPPGGAAVPEIQGRVHGRSLQRVRLLFRLDARIRPDAGRGRFPRPAYASTPAARRGGDPRPSGRATGRKKGTEG